MNIPDVTPNDFLEFFEAIDEHFLHDEFIYFDGRCNADDAGDYENWVFCLVNLKRTVHLFVPPKIAFFYINLVLVNVSPLPSSIGTEYTSCLHLKSLCRKNRLHHLTSLYPYTKGQYYNRA